MSLRACPSLDTTSETGGFSLIVPVDPGMADVHFDLSVRDGAARNPTVFGR